MNTVHYNTLGLQCNVLMSCCFRYLSLLARRTLAVVVLGYKVRNCYTLSVTHFISDLDFLDSCSFFTAYTPYRPNKIISQLQSYSSALAHELTPTELSKSLQSQFSLNDGMP